MKTKRVSVENLIFNYFQGRIDRSGFLAIKLKGEVSARLDYWVRGM